MADGGEPERAHERSAWLLLPAPLRHLPADLAAVAGLTVFAVLSALLPIVRETPLRVVLGLPFVLFFPGYAFVAALFPEAGEPPGEGSSPGDLQGDDDSRSTGDASSTDDHSADGTVGAVVGDRGIDGIERVALSFGLSIAIVPLIGLVLNFTPWGIRLVPILLSVSAFTLAAAAVAAVRRWELPSEDRFRVPYREWLAAGREELFEPASRADAALNVLLVLSVVLAATSVGYAVLVPNQGEAFTEFYLLTEDDDGGLVAADYPTEFERGEARPLVVGIGNQEHETVDYSVVVELHRVQLTNGSADDLQPVSSWNASDAARTNYSLVVVEERELDRFETSLTHNETWHHHHEVAPTMTGEHLRLTYLLYRGDPPADPTVDDAYRELHLWVNVSAPE